MDYPRQISSPKHSLECSLIQKQLITKDLIRPTIDGLKTMTRRVILPQPEVFYNARNPDISCLKDPKRHWKKGDLIWVKEGYAVADVDADEDIAIVYRADEDVEWFKDKAKCFKRYDLNKWKSPLFMPKWVARLWLEIVDIRAERLQEITEDEIFAEGLCPTSEELAYLEWIDLWDSINTKRGYPWSANPWVWRISFKGIK